MFFKTWVVQPISFSIMGWFNQYSFNMGCIITTSCFSNIGCQQRTSMLLGIIFYFKNKKRIILYLFDLNHGVAKTPHRSSLRTYIFTQSCLVLSYIFQGAGGTCNPPSRSEKNRGQVVCGHGDFKPSNVIQHEGRSTDQRWFGGWRFWLYRYTPENEFVP